MCRTSKLHNIIFRQISYSHFVHDIIWCISIHQLLWFTIIISISVLLCSSSSIYHIPISFYSKPSVFQCFSSITNFYFNAYHVILHYSKWFIQSSSQSFKTSSHYRVQNHSDNFTCYCYNFTWYCYSNCSIQSLQSLVSSQATHCCYFHKLAHILIQFCWPVYAYLHCTTTTYWPSLQYDHILRDIYCSVEKLACKDVILGYQLKSDTKLNVGVNNVILHVKSYIWKSKFLNLVPSYNKLVEYIGSRMMLEPDLENLFENM